MLYTIAGALLTGTLFCALAAAAFAALFADKRALSFFPVKSDPLAAENSALKAVFIAQGLIALALTICCAVVLYAFIMFDFRLEYVVRYSDRTLPLFYRFTALWAGRSGSLLFWAWTVALSGAIFSLTPAYGRLSARTRLLFWAFFLGIMAFFLPALKPNERKWVLPTFFTGVLLFAIGLVFCYLIILDPAFAWLLDQATGFAQILANAAEFIPIILLFEIAFGLAFQLPLIVFYLIVFNIVPYKKLRKSWRVVYVALLVFCALVTPDASPVTMFLMFAAIAVLYELSLFISRIVLRKRIKAKEAELAAEEAEEDEDDA